jgi:3-hydroxyisobutyrate dehydrogenase
MKTGFIGMGSLGRAIAERLTAQGCSLTVWNRTLEKCEGLGAEIAQTPAAVAESADVIVLNLFDTAAVFDVLWMENGLLSADLEGKVIVDTTTNHFNDVLQVYEEIDSMGGLYLEAPVIGSVVPAQNGQLLTLASGSEEAFEKGKTVLELFSRKIHYLGSEGLSSKMKVINNMLLGVFCTGIAEAVVLGEKAGMTKSDVLDILADGAGNSMVMNAKRKKIEDEEFSAHFSGSCLFKDLAYLQELANDMKLPLYTGSVAKNVYAEMFRKGISSEDMSAVYKVFK